MTKCPSNTVNQNLEPEWGGDGRTDVPVEVESALAVLEGVLSNMAIYPNSPSSSFPHLFFG